MDLREKLADLKNRAMVAVGEAAKERDAGSIVFFSDLVSEIERDEKAAMALEDRAGSYEARLRGPGEMLGAAQPLRPIGPSSAKRRGREIREEFTSRHPLRPERGVIYRTQSSSRVGIAVATETGPNRWFLGLPDTQLDCVVLLCHAGEHVLDFVLPMTSLSDVWPQLSRSGGQVKFNVNRRNGAYHLQVPGAGPLDIRPFLGRYGPLA